MEYGFCRTVNESSEAHGAQEGSRGGESVWNAIVLNV